jgi:hypothetical protein
MDCFAGLILVRLGHSPAEDSSAGATKLKSFEGGVLKELEDLSTRHKSYCWMWEHRADMNEAEGCCIKRATASDYIHNQMSKQVTRRVT